MIGERSSRDKLSACMEGEKDSKTGCGNASQPKVAGKRLDCRGSNRDAAGEQLPRGVAGTERSLSCCAKVKVCIWTVQ